MTLCAVQSKKNTAISPQLLSAVLFGAGRRLFDVLPARIELKIVRVIDTPEATHIRYCVVRN
jgi:hypothetical protein